MPKSPLLGSLAVQTPSEPPRLVRVNPSTCHDLSLFKDLLREYRRLDDAIVMRLNRANAQFRDLDRLGTDGKGNLEDQSCAHIWIELVENWKRRRELVEYCASVVDRSLEEKRKVVEAFEGDTASRRKAQAVVFSEEVKRNQVHNELTVERIIQQRSLEAIRTRCKYFEPSASSPERPLWNTPRSP